MSVLDQLTEVLEQRKRQDPETSYVASLHSKGLNKILEKVGEEATEVILAAKDAQNHPAQTIDVVKETADLWFHTMVMLSALDLSTQDVLDELAERFGVGGLRKSQPLMHRTVTGATKHPIIAPLISEIPNVWIWYTRTAGHSGHRAADLRT